MDQDWNTLSNTVENKVARQKKLSAEFRSRMAIALSLVAIGCAAGIYVTDQASLSRHADAVHRVEQQQKVLEKRTVQFCNEYKHTRHIIRDRAISQRQITRLLVRLTDNIPGKEFAEAHNSFVKAEKEIKIIPVEVCPFN